MGKNFGLIPSIFFLVGYLDQLTLMYSETILNLSLVSFEFKHLKLELFKQ